MGLSSVVLNIIIASISIAALVVAIIGINRTGGSSDGSGGGGFSPSWNGIPGPHALTTSNDSLKPLKLLPGSTNRIGTIGGIVNIVVGVNNVLELTFSETLDPIPKAVSVNGFVRVATTPIVAAEAYVKDLTATKLSMVIVAGISESEYEPLISYALIP